MTLFALYLACCFVTTVLILHHNLVVVPRAHAEGVAKEAQHLMEYTSLNTVFLAIVISPIFLLLVLALTVVALIKKLS